MTRSPGLSSDVLDRIVSSPRYRGQLAAVREIRGREARAADPALPLPPILKAKLAARGIHRLHLHQARALDLARAGRDVVVVTGTASGKSLCYLLPVFESLLRRPAATALCLFPTKALTRDQVRGFEHFRDPVGGLDFLSGPYDGDTPGDLRRRLREKGNVILTNPDMLHQAILPHHARWSRFFANLETVVVDEVHAYRGVFGSHLANVMRRLSRIARHHGANPRFVACSATIGNPGEHAARILGRPVEVIDEDGSPRGPRQFVLWNPPPLAGLDSSGGGDRRSALTEGAELLAALVAEGIQSILFTRTRLSAELVARTAREIVGRSSRRLPRTIHAYRGGYLPEERRAVEQGLVDGSILGVASTNALELGIDIGSLDACILLGYPGSIASLHQQAGRAGRGTDASLVFFVARNTPVDQYLVRASDWIFTRSPERAVTDPDNPHVTVGHLRCAAHEMPIEADEEPVFGETAPDVLDLLGDEGVITRIGDRHYHSAAEYPASQVSLRNLAGPVITIQDDSDGGKVIGTLDLLSALSQLHDHAVYLHGPETFMVDRLDLDRNLAHVSRRELEYYTQSIQVSRIRIDSREEESEEEIGTLGFGEVTVSTEIPLFKKVRFGTRESLGFERLELPPQDLETTACWFLPPDPVGREMRREGFALAEALTGLANVLVDLVPVFLSCDPEDVGAIVDASQTSGDALFVYDRCPGGMGYARACLDRFPEILAAAGAVIRGCPCERGCLSCVGSATPAAAVTDADAAVRGRIPDKRAARRLVEGIVPDREIASEARSLPVG